MNGRTNSSDVTIQEINYGALIPLEAPTNLVLTPLNARVDITWTDPVDKVASPGGEDVALWDRTVIIRKAGSAPTGPDDGELIYTETTRNQHQYDVYSDTNNVVNNTVYYYAVYAYTQMDVPSEPIGGNCKPLAGVPEYYGTTPVALDNNHKNSQTSGTFAGYVLYTGDSGTLGGVKYDSSLTQSFFNALDYSREPSSGMSCANTTNHAIFAGGEGMDSYSTNATAVDTSFTKIELERLSTGSSSAPGATYRNYTTGISFQGCAIIAGGDGYYCPMVDKYDDSLTHATLTDLRTGKRGMGAIVFSNKALFGGGYYYNKSYYLSDMEVYDTSFTKSSATGLSQGRYNVATALIGDYAIFAGTDNASSLESDIVDAYDASLTRVTLDQILVDDYVVDVKGHLLVAMLCFYMILEIWQ